jgi:hypothetical protein
MEGIKETSQVEMITLGTDTLRLFFTNLTGRKVRFTITHYYAPNDTLVIPMGVSSICYCPLGPMATPLDETRPCLIANSSDTKIEIITDEDMPQSVIYIQLSSKSIPQSLRNLTTTMVRDQVASLHRLDQKLFTSTELPKRLVDEICDTSLDLQPDADRKNSKQQFRCPCRSHALSTCFDNWTFNPSRSVPYAKSQHTNRRYRKLKTHR